MSGALISVPNRAIVCPARLDVRTMFAEAPAGEIHGSPVMVLPHDDHHTRVLRNMGFIVNAPIVHYYDWPGRVRPYASQKRTAAMLTMNPRAYVLSDMGTGKTMSILYAADWLMSQGTIRSTLVVAPLSTLKQVWWNEIQRHFPHRYALVLHGTREQRKAKLQEQADFYIINHDGIGTVLEELIDHPEIDLVVIDELGVYRTYGTDRWRAIRSVTRQREWVWGATGTPTPNGPIDAWAQARIVTPHTVPSQKGKWVDMTTTQQGAFTRLPRKGANDTVMGALRPHVRYRREDVMELPPTIYQDFKVELAPATAKLVKALHEGFAEAVAAGVITAANAGVAVSKVVQAASGWVYTDNGGVHVTDAKLRIEQTCDLIDASESKTIVFVPYKHSTVGLLEHLRKRGYNCGQIDGSVAPSKRPAIFDAFQNPSHPMKVLVAHPRAMAHGLTLTAASVTVWYAPPASLDDYVQANARMTRPGQKYKTLIAHVFATRVEQKLFKKLKTKELHQADLLAMLASASEL